MKILFIVGLPGSGKTCLSKALYFNCIDDITDKQQLLNLTDLTIVIDPFLCIETNRKQAELFLQENYDSIQIEWLFFENDLIKCLNNCKSRNKFVSDRFIKDLSINYQPPNRSIKVWDRKKDVYFLYYDNGYCVSFSDLHSLKNVTECFDKLGINNYWLGW